MRSSIPTWCLAYAAVFQMSCAIQGGAANSGDNSDLRSEVDSFTPRTERLDPAASAAALTKLDSITNTYLKEAVDWANTEPDCNGHCMAMIVSETLAETQSRDAVTSKLTDIRNGKPYGRWGYIPQVPGWRGFQGEIEHLLSRGRTQDGRYSLDAGIIRLPLKDSVFRTVGRLDSPGSFLEVGAILPIDLTPSGLRVFIGSDKFGHFLSTGFEYLEAYLETYDETITQGRTPEEAKDHAEFAMYVRGLLTEVTSLGGWFARVFSYADLSANHDGYAFFTDIYHNRSRYLRQNPRTKKWELTNKPFAWRDVVDPSWDEGLNCSHYFASITGSNAFQQKIVAELVDLKTRYNQRFVCPIDMTVCKSIVEKAERKFGKVAAEALISPQCLEAAKGQRKPIELSHADMNKDADELNAIGFYSGEFIVERSKTWCRTQREKLVAKSCASRPLPNVSADACPQKIIRVSSERFRCELDTRDFLGWSL